MSIYEVSRRIILSIQIRLLQIRLRWYLPGYKKIVHELNDKVQLFVDLDERDGTAYLKLRSLLNQYPEEMRDPLWLETSILLDGAEHRYAQRTLTHLIRLKDAYCRDRQQQRFEKFWKRFTEVLYPYTLTDHGYNASIESRNTSTVWSNIAEIFSFLSSVGYECFINSGTLLGIVRDGQLIAHDDDVDLAVILKSSSDEAVADEWIRLGRSLEPLRTKGLKLSSDGNIQYQFVCEGGLTVDLFPCWIKEEKIYIYPYAFGEASESDLLPLKTVEISGHMLAMPRLQDVFLNLNYGMGWETPDPAFRFNWAKARENFSALGSRLSQVRK